MDIDDYKLVTIPVGKFVCFSSSSVSKCGVLAVIESSDFARRKMDHRKGMILLKKAEFEVRRLGMQAGWERQ